MTADTSIRYGATESDWDTFSMLLDLTADLLPVVSNPNIPISPKSKMKGIGKTPSIINRDGFIAGFPDWTQRVATDKDIKTWKACGDLGLCIQTRRLRAIDVDIKDEATAKRVKTFIGKRYKLPVRFRRDSNKFLLAFYVVGEIPKSVLYMEPKETRTKGSPQIEFLGNGQQFVACGTHPDGARYEWDWQELKDFPTLTTEQYTELREELAKEFAVEQSTVSVNLRKARVDGTAVVSDDYVASFLLERNHVLEVGRNGELFIECPWIGNHSGDSGVSQTTYFPAGGRGYQQGHFKCLHAGCQHREDGDFIEAFDVYANLFEPLPPEQVNKGEVARLPLPGFMRNKHGAIMTTLPNIGAALLRSDFCGMEIRLDTFRDEIMWTTPDQPSGWRTFGDVDQVRLRVCLELKGFEKGAPPEMTRHAVLEHADRNQFDSAIEWLTKEVPAWDGTPRCERFLHQYFGVEDSDYSRAVSLYLWTALAGRVLEPGCKADMAPILVGPQGSRKSSAVAAIVPDEDFFIEVDLEKDDDTQARLMRGKLIGEISELRGLQTRELGEIKAFVVRRFDKWIPKYREFATKFPRRLVLVGTTNDDEFLADTTGNRRWLPVVIGKEKIDVDGIVRDRDQLWAEARGLFTEGGVDWTAERLANEAHQLHTISDPWEQTVIDYMDTPQEVTGETVATPRQLGYVVLTDVAQDALRMDVKSCERKVQTRLGAIFRKLGMVKVDKRVNGKKKKVWVWSDK